MTTIGCVASRFLVPGVPSAAKQRDQQNSEGFLRPNFTRQTTALLLIPPATQAMTTIAKFIDERKTINVQSLQYETTLWPSKLDNHHPFLRFHKRLSWCLNCAHERYKITDKYLNIRSANFTQKASIFQKISAIFVSFDFNKSLLANNNYMGKDKPKDRLNLIIF